MGPCREDERGAALGPINPSDVADPQRTFSQKPQVPSGVSGEGRAREGRTAIGAASFQAKSLNRKLSPVEFDPDEVALIAAGLKPGRPHPRAVGPYISSSYVAMAATCSPACPLRPEASGGCYGPTGLTKGLVARLDDAALGHTADEVIAEQRRLIDASFPRGVPRDGGRHGDRGRDHRLNVVGDFRTVGQAGQVGAAAEGYKTRGGGAFFGFTHSWRDVPREALGPAVSMLASVEALAEIEAARTRGYPAALTVPQFRSQRPFRLPSRPELFIPCPYEASGKTTCVKCRLCMGADELRDRNEVIVFEHHGPGAKRMGLVQLRRKDDPGARPALAVAPGTSR